MATRLDQQIAQLENIVEQHLDLCQVMCNGSRCILPRNHAATEPHKFLIEFLEMLATAEHTEVFADRAHQVESGRAQNW